MRRLERREQPDLRAGTVRRSGRAAVLLSLVLAALPARAETAPNYSPAPVVRSAERVVDLSQSLPAATIAAPIAFRAFGMRWQGGAAAPQQPGVSVRFSRDGATWSAWMLPGVDADTSDPARFELYFALVVLDTLQSHVEVAVAEPWRGAGSRLSLVFIDPGESAPLRTAAAPRLRAASDSLARPPLVSRTEWGCPEGESSSWPPEYTDVTHLIVHHTATANVSSDWPAQVRSIWSFHAVTRGWGDIGYNYLIDPLGTVYEGRSGGDDVIGAHFSCQNANTMGVALLGTFETEQPTPAALASLEQLLAWKAARRGIDPLGTAHHPGMDLELATITGHRAGNDSPNTCTITTCPGDALDALLPEVRTSVADAIAAPEPAELASSGGALVALAALCGTRRRRPTRFSVAAGRSAPQWLRVRRLRARRARARGRP